jgi:hypothetical protein
MKNMEEIDNLWQVCYSIFDCRIAEADGWCFFLRFGL